MQDESKPGMQCAEYETLLAEALDATLHGATLGAFEAHRKSCPACTALYEQAAAGMHWLQQLEDIEPPKNLVHNILVHTIGSIPEVSARQAAANEGWLEKLKTRVSPLFAPVMTPRFAMSFGMAFFSLTMLANVVGIRASDWRHVDLTAKGVQRTYYATQARIVRYYENIRLVYEIESRVRDLRRAATPEEKPQEDAKPKNRSGKDPQQNQKYQQYRGDAGQPELAGVPAIELVVNPQARPNRRTA